MVAIAALTLVGCSKKNTAGTYSIGSYYEKDGVEGVIYKVSADGMHGMIVSLKESESLKWSTETITTSATHTANGVANMDKIKAISGWESKYPVFKWCDDLNTGGVSGWYLPAKDELAQLFAGYCGLSAYPGYESDADTKYAAACAKFNDALTQHGGVAIGASFHWSSSENGSFSAYYQHLCFGNQNLDNKGLTCIVRAVRAF